MLYKYMCVWAVDIGGVFVTFEGKYTYTICTHASFICINAYLL